MKRYFVIAAIIAAFAAAPTQQVAAAPAPPSVVPYLLWLGATPECQSGCWVDSTLLVDLSSCVVAGTEAPALVSGGSTALNAVEIEVRGTVDPKGFQGFGMSTIGSIATPVEISLDVSAVPTTEGGKATTVIFDMRIVHRTPGNLHIEDVMVVDGAGSIVTMGYRSSCTFGYAA